MEQEKETILNSLIEHVIYQDTEMRIQWANQAACESANMTFGELVGRYCYEIWPRRNVPCTDCPVLKAIETEQPQKIVKSTSDGRSWYIRGYPVKDEEGKIVGGIEVTMEITKHKQAEEALRESEKRYRAVVESQTEMICRFLPDGRLTFVNEAYCRYFNKNQDELIGHKFMPLIPDSDQEKVFKNIVSLNPSSPTITHEHRVIAPSGEICWHKWTNRAIFDDQNNLTEYQAVGWDITERVRAEEALKKAYDELEQRVQERTEELELKTKSLEEMNTAMEVLLEKRQKDKTDLEDNVLTNVKELIEPYFDKVKKTKLDEQQKTLLSIIKSNMNEIVSPFTRKLSLQYLKLTPTEIKIANMIKQGYTTKKIAEIINTSPRTVDTHRRNIRQKIGLKKKGENLRSYLLSIH